MKSETLTGICLALEAVDAVDNQLFKRQRFTVAI